VWASLRFDDHRGLAPSAVQFTPRGLEAVLSRTKTTGPGKRVTALPVVVGFGAFLRQPQWLETGWRLWQATAPFVRGYFLVKPASDLNTTLPVELSYEQAARVSRAVLAGLPREDDVLPAFAEPVVGLFTLHSARCWLASMAALVGVPDADLSYLGRWSPTTSKSYVRTAIEVVVRVQEAVAASVRKDLAGDSVDIIGEQAAYLDLRRELMRRGHDEGMISEQFDTMQAWTYQLAESPIEHGLQGWSRVEPVEVADGSGKAGEVEDGAAAEDEGPEGGSAPPTPPCLPGAAEEAPPRLPVDEQPEAPPTSGFVVSLSKTDWRKLHRIGGCARLLGCIICDSNYWETRAPGPRLTTISASNAGGRAGPRRSPTRRTQRPRLRKRKPRSSSRIRWARRHRPRMSTCERGPVVHQA